MENIIKINEQKNEIELNIGIALDKREGGWIAFCPSLKVLGYSNESKEKAFEDLKLSFNDFFQVHFEDDTLEEALSSFGWTTKFMENKKPISNPFFKIPSPVSIPSQSFNIPVYA